jgi:hypothetical protein
MDKTWRKSRTISHWILKQLFSEFLKGYSDYFLIDNKGRVFVNLNGQRYMFESSQTRIVFLQGKSNYSLKELTESINLLMANNHVEMDMIPDNMGIEHIFFKATALGALAYQEGYYLKQIEEHKAEWPKRNWPYVAIISFALGSIIVPLALKYTEKALWPETIQQPKANPVVNYILNK